MHAFATRLSRGIGDLSPDPTAVPELNAAVDLANKLGIDESAVQNIALWDPTGLKAKKETMQAQVLSADRKVRSAIGLPDGLRTRYMSFRSAWQTYYLQTPGILTASQDFTRFKSLQAEFGELVGELSSYVDMSDVPSPGSAPGFPVTTIAVVGGLVFLGIALVVASNVYGASKGISHAVGNALGSRARSGTRALARRSED